MLDQIEPLLDMESVDLGGEAKAAEEGREMNRERLQELRR